MPRFTLNVLLKNLTVTSTRDKILDLQTKIFELKRQLFSDNENTVLKRKIEDNEEQLEKLQKQERDEEAALERKHRADQATKDILHARFLEAREKLKKLNDLAYDSNRKQETEKSEVAMGLQSDTYRISRLSLMAGEQQEIASLSMKIRNTIDMMPLQRPLPKEIHDCIMALSDELDNYFNDSEKAEEGTGDLQFQVLLAELADILKDVLLNWGNDDGQNDRPEACRLLQHLKLHTVSFTQLDIHKPRHRQIEAKIVDWTQTIEKRLNDDDSPVLSTTIAPTSVPPELPDMSRLSLDKDNIVDIVDTDTVYKEILYWNFDEPFIAENGGLPGNFIAKKAMKKFVEDRKNMLHRLILCKFDTTHGRFRHYLPHETIEPIRDEELQQFDYSVVNKFEVFECLKEIIQNFWKSAPQIHMIGHELQRSVNDYFQRIYDGLMGWHKQLRKSMQFFDKNKKAYLELDFEDDGEKINLIEGLPPVRIHEDSPAARVDPGVISRQGRAARRIYRRQFSHDPGESPGLQETGKRKTIFDDDSAGSRPSRRAGSSSEPSKASEPPKPTIVDDDADKRAGSSSKPSTQRSTNPFDTESDSDHGELQSFLQNSKCPYAWKFVSYLLHKIPDDVSE